MSSGNVARRVPSGTQDNYFNIDDILCTQERLVCTFEIPVPNMGYLDTSAETPHIQARAKVELPCWLARSLAGGNRRKRTATVELPKQYCEGYREILSAEAGVVDLHRLGPYYYAFGSRLLLHFEHAESGDIARSLLKAFQARLRRIMDGCQNAFDSNTTNLMETLDESERRIFRQGQSGLSSFLLWETRQTEKLAASAMVSNLKKRKRAQRDDDDS